MVYVKTESKTQDGFGVREKLMLTSPPITNERYWYAHPREPRLLVFEKQEDTKWYFTHGKKDRVVLTGVGLALLSPPTDEQIGINEKTNPRKRAAKERGAVFESNGFEGNRYNPALDPKAAEELRALALRWYVACQTNLEELADTLGIPVDCIYSKGDKSNFAKFEVVFSNTRRVRELCDRLKIYVNPYVFFGENFDEVAVCSRGLCEELRAAGVPASRWYERIETNEISA